MNAGVAVRVEMEGSSDIVRVVGDYDTCGCHG